MKRLMFVAVSVLAVSVLSLSAIKITRENAPSESSSEALQQTRLVEQPQYIMREYEGKLAVFDLDGVLYEIIDFRVSLLPEYDQKLLKNGIHIDGEAELRARIEDYTG